MRTQLKARLTLSDRVAEEIRALMARRLVKQSDLARQLDTNDQWLSVRLRGRQPIDLNDLERIADALGVDVNDLMPERKAPQVTSRKVRTNAYVPRPKGRPDAPTGPSNRARKSRPTQPPRPHMPASDRRPVLNRRFAG